MAEPPSAPRVEDLPEALPARRPWQWAHLIWVVPVVAIVVGGWLVARHLLHRGPTVQISFQTAAGLEAGKTRVKYKDVDVGTVRDIGLSEDRKRVIVAAELTPSARTLLAEDTRFWVVRPRIAGGQALGLATLLSGAYIAMDPGKSQESRREFVGLENPPVVTSDTPGRSFMLRGDDLGSVDVGSPVYYRRVRVGQTVAAELNADGKGVTFRVFVEAPYDRYVTAQTRFWNVSGVDVSLDSGGFRVQTESLAAVVIGGIAFQEPPELAGEAPAAAENTAFVLFKDRDTALKQPISVVERYILHFNQSVRGLSPGSSVDIRGVPIGEVTRVNIDYNRTSGAIRPAVEIHIYPERIAQRFRQPAPAYDPARRAQTLQRFVALGLRAQLRTANMITGQLYVSLDFFPQAPPVKVDLARRPLEIPTVPGGFDQLQASAERVLNRLEKVPFDRIGEDLRAALGVLDATLREVGALTARLDREIAPELREALRQARETMAKAQGALDEDSPTQHSLGNTLREVRRAAESVRSLADYLERHPESLLRGKREERQQ